MRLQLIHIERTQKEASTKNTSPTQVWASTKFFQSSSSSSLSNYRTSDIRAFLLLLPIWRPLCFASDLIHHQLAQDEHTRWKEGKKSRVTYAHNCKCCCCCCCSFEYATLDGILNESSCCLLAMIKWFAIFDILPTEEREREKEKKEKPTQQ